MGAISAGLTEITNCNIHIANCNDARTEASPVAAARRGAAGARPRAHAVGARPGDPVRARTADHPVLSFAHRKRPAEPPVPPLTPPPPPILQIPPPASPHPPPPTPTPPHPP